MRFVWVLLLGACGGGGDDGTDGPSTLSPCAEGCAETLAAACPNGPATEEVCVSDCEALLAGACAEPYDAVLACSEGEAVTCDAGGRPTVEACADEFAAFVGCLNG